MSRFLSSRSPTAAAPPEPGGPTSPREVGAAERGRKREREGTTARLGPTLHRAEKSERTTHARGSARTGARRATALSPSPSGWHPGGFSTCGGRAGRSHRVGPSLLGRGVRTPRVPLQLSSSRDAARRIRSGKVRPRRQVAFMPTDSPAAAYRHDEKANTQGIPLSPLGSFLKRRGHDKEPARLGNRSPLCL